MTFLLRRFYFCSLALLLVLSIGAAKSSFAGDGQTAQKRLAEAVAAQTELVTTLRAEFHRLKYEKIPHAYSRYLVDVEKIVGKIGSNSATIEQEIIPDLKLTPTGSAQADGASSASGKSMTAEELANWIMAHESKTDKRVKAAITMFPYVSNLNLMTLEKLAYAIGGDPYYKYNRKKILEAGQEFLAKQQVK